MKSTLSELNLIDLISDSHLHLRRIAEERWKKTGGDDISHTEGHLLARIHQNPLSISEASRLLNISRQAMQKCARGLEERDYLAFEYREGNKRDKYMFLTGKGRSYCLESDAMKGEMESEIAADLGCEQVEILKDLLWKIWKEKRDKT